MTEQRWLTPQCNDFRCARDGACVHARPACTEYLREQDAAEAEDDAPQRGAGPTDARGA